MAAVKVPRRFGERARVFISSIGALDRSSRIFAARDSLYIGVSRRLSDGEAVELKKICPFSYSLKRLSPAKEKLKTIDGLLSKSLSTSELSLVKNSFDIVGDIAILQIPPGLEAREKDVAKALMEVHRNIRVVCRKSGIVSGEYRILPVEAILGEKRTWTVHREHGCLYRIDISKAFFTPRLATERMRIASQCKPKETVVDMFAGVGPFSILIAKRSGARVFAVDLNRDAYGYLVENIGLNKVGGLVTPILGDAKALCSKQLKDSADRVIMNLPKHAFGFFPAALKCLKQKGVAHYHFFAREREAGEHIAKLKALAKKKGASLKVISLKKVRQVAPREWNWAADLRIVKKGGRKALAKRNPRRD